MFARHECSLISSRGCSASPTCCMWGWEPYEGHAGSAWSASNNWWNYTGLLLLIVVVTIIFEVLCWCRSASESVARDCPSSQMYIRRCLIGGACFLADTAWEGLWAFWVSSGWHLPRSAWSTGALYSLEGGGIWRRMVAICLATPIFAYHCKTFAACVWRVLECPQSLLSLCVFYQNYCNAGNFIIYVCRLCIADWVVQRKRKSGLEI